MRTRSALMNHALSTAQAHRPSDEHIVFIHGLSLVFEGRRYSSATSSPHRQARVDVVRQGPVGDLVDAPVGTYRREGSMLLWQPVKPANPSALSKSSGPPRPVQAKSTPMHCSWQRQTIPPVWRSTWRTARMVMEHGEALQRHCFRQRIDHWISIAAVRRHILGGLRHPGVCEDRWPRTARFQRERCFSAS